MNCSRRRVRSRRPRTGPMATHRDPGDERPHCPFAAKTLASITAAAKSRGASWSGGGNSLSRISTESTLTVVEELLARDLVVRDGVEADLFERDALARALVGDLEREGHRELVRSVEERTAHLLGEDLVVALPDLGLLDDRPLALGLGAVSFDRDDGRRVHRAHDVEVLALVAQLDEPDGNSAGAHGEFLSLEGEWMGMGRSRRLVAVVRQKADLARVSG